MKTLQPLITVSLGLLLCCGCRTHRDVTTKLNNNLQNEVPTNSVPQMSQVAKHVLQELNLNAGSAIVVSPLNSTNTTASKSEYIIIRPPPGMSDGYTHTIRIDHNTRQYWWTKQGGFAGIYEKYGPIQYQEKESNKAPAATPADKCYNILDEFAILITSREYDKAYNLMMADMHRSWPLEEFKKDLERIHSIYKKKWSFVRPRSVYNYDANYTGLLYPTISCLLSNSTSIRYDIKISALTYGIRNVQIVCPYLNDEIKTRAYCTASNYVDALVDNDYSAARSYIDGYEQKYYSDNVMELMNPNTTIMGDPVDGQVVINELLSCNILVDGIWFNRVVCMYNTISKYQYMDIIIDLSSNKILSVTVTKCVLRHSGGTIKRIEFMHERLNKHIKIDLSDFIL